MLRIIACWAGRRVAWLAALVYLAGVIMPSIALAFSDSAVSAYCFDEIAAPRVHVHVHNDGAVHHHVDKTSAHAVQGQGEKSQSGIGGQNHSHDANCCGLFGFTAVLPALIGAIAEPAAYHIQPPILANCLVGCGPDRINRPPIILLPM